MRIGRPAARFLSEIVADADFAMATHKLTGLGAGGAAGHSLQYQQAILEALLEDQGDIIVRGASVAGKLAKITTGQILEATETGYQGVAKPVPKTIATGSYTGNDGDDRQVTTGFKCSLVFICVAAAEKMAIMFPNISLDFKEGAAWTSSGLHATDGFSVYHTADGLNTTGITYYYWAISE